MVPRLGMPELALNDVQRHVLAREFKCVRVAQLMRREPAPHAHLGGVAHDGDDLVDRRRIGGIADSLVARWAAGV